VPANVPEFVSRVQRDRGAGEAGTEPAWVSAYRPRLLDETRLWPNAGGRPLRHQASSLIDVPHCASGSGANVALLSGIIVVVEHRQMPRGHQQTAREPICLPLAIAVDLIVVVARPHHGDMPMY